MTAQGVLWSRYCAGCHRTSALLVYADHYLCAICGYRYEMRDAPPEAPPVVRVRSPFVRWSDRTFGGPDAGEGV